MQSEHDGSDIQVEFNVEHHQGEDIVPNMTRSPRVKYITYYEDSESITGKRTAVWEIDKGAFKVFGLLMNSHDTSFIALAVLMNCIAYVIGDNIVLLTCIVQSV